MKRLLPAPLIILTAIAAFSQSPLSEGESTFATLFAEISAHYPRLEGSPGEKRTIDLIVNTARGLGLDPFVSSFDDLVDNHSYSSSVAVEVAGATDDLLIIAVPLNHVADASAVRDGSVGLALALSVMSRYAVQTPPVSLQFLFLGGEKGQGRGYPIGSHVFVREFFPQGPAAVLYLDIEAPVDIVTVIRGGGGTVSPPWLVGRVEHAGSSAGVTLAVPPNLDQVYRLRAEDEPTSIAPFLAAGIPSVGLASSSVPVAIDGDWGVAYQAVLSAFVESFRTGVPVDWPRHFLRMSLGGSSFTIGERGYVAGLLSLLVLALGYGMLYRWRFARYMRTIGRNAWSLPVYLGLIFLFLLLATLLMRGFFLLRSIPSLWQAAPLQYFLMKIFLAVFLFSLWSQSLRSLPFSKNGSFYSASALLFLFLDIVILAVINISLTYYFVWAFFFAFLFSIFRNRFLKAITLLLSPVWLVKAAFDLLLLPELNLAEILLLTPVRGNLLLAFFTLPFLLMLVRMDYLIRHPIRGGHGFTLKLSTAASGFVTIAFVLYLVVHEPYGPENPQPIHATELIDAQAGSRRLELDSPAPLGDLLILYGDRQYDVSSGLRELFLPQPEARQTLRVGVDERRFLGRVRYTIELEPLSIRPRTVSLSLEAADQAIVVYDCNFPYALSEQARRVNVYIGQNPPMPVRIVVTLAPVARLRLSVGVTSSETLEPIFIVGQDIVPRIQSRISGRLELVGEPGR